MNVYVENKLLRVMVAAGLVITALNLPWIIEDVGNNCEALENRTMNLHTQGRLAVIAAHIDMPALPSPLVCELRYFQSWFKPRREKIDARARDRRD